MFILLAVLAAAALGALIQVLSPHKEARGLAVSAAIAGGLSAVSYAAMTWLGVGQDSVWLWLVSIFATVAIAWIATGLLTRARVEAVRAEEQRLKL